MVIKKQIDIYEVLLDDDDMQIAHSFAYPVLKSSGKIWFYSPASKQPLHRHIFSRTHPDAPRCWFLDGNSCNLQRANLSPTPTGAKPKKAQKDTVDSGSRKISSSSNSGYIGVFLNTSRGSYRVHIRKDKRSYIIGHFGANPDFAALAYNYAAQLIWGDSATLNLVNTSLTLHKGDKTRILKKLKACGLI